MSFYSSNSNAMDRQNEVQRLVIPFTVTHSATASAVVLACDEPSILFLKSEGVDQIAAALAAGETATYSASPNDANGILNMFVRIVIGAESASKVMQASVIDRATGVQQPCKLGSASGLSSLGNIMLTLDSTVNFSSTDGDSCLIVEYIVSQS